VLAGLKRKKKSNSEIRVGNVVLGSVSVVAKATLSELGTHVTESFSPGNHARLAIKDAHGVFYYGELKPSRDIQRTKLASDGEEEEKRPSKPISYSYAPTGLRRLEDE